MNAPWIIAGTLAIALFLPQQPGRSDSEPNGPVTVFEKQLPSGQKLIVTCEDVPLVLTPQQAAEQAQVTRDRPGTLLSDHLQEFTFVTVAKGGRRDVVWTMHNETFGAVRPGTSDDFTMAIHIYDVALRGSKLYVLYQQNRRTKVNIVRLKYGKLSPSARKGAKYLQTPTDKDAVQSPYDAGRLLERAGPFDAVVDGRLIGPTVNGEVTAELSHHGKRQDGSPRLTVYHLTHDAEDREYWTPDPVNVYKTGEHPGIEDFLKQNR